MEEIKEIKNKSDEICKLMTHKFINDLKIGMKIATDEGWGNEELYQEDVKKLDKIDNICKM